jgi:tight adherence protein C
LLYNAGQKRESLMRKALPDALDLLTVSVEAGLAFDGAVGRVARNTSGPLAQEFQRLLQEMQIGRGRVEAMRGMAERTSLDDLRAFCTSMVQADSLGIPIGRVLRIQSEEMRTKRRQRAEEKAQQVPVKIMVPLVLFILPCLFIVVMGPAAIGIMDAFS